MIVPLLRTQFVNKEVVIKHDAESLPKKDHQACAHSFSPLSIHYPSSIPDAGSSYH